MIEMIREKICPKCKSPDVSPDFSIQAFGQKAEFNKYKCNKCGFNSIFFPEIIKNLKWQNQLS